jgi:polysaccharide deacetylase family protein (PEP-CTERM system associated)
MALIMSATPITNALTIDVEDYFQVSAFAPYVDRTQWDSMECRVERNVHRLLDLLSEKNSLATFFTLGWIAERYPSLVRRIVSEGHELASHGYGHQRVTDLSRADFKEDVIRAKQLLEDIGGVAVAGYRAPSFSIGEQNLWALDVLLGTGHRYSSSIYPIKHDHYGSPDSPRFVYECRPGFIEVPPTTVRLLNRNLPSSGGGYFRLLPYAVSKWMLQRVNTLDCQAAVFYLHPWEIDAAQPRMTEASLKSQFRHYINIDRMEDRLGRLLDDFSWARMDQVFLSH